MEAGKCLGCQRLRVLVERLISFLFPFQVDGNQPHTNHSRNQCPRRVVNDKTKLLTMQKPNRDTPNPAPASTDPTQARIWYIRLFKDQSFPVAERIARRGFYIPSGLALSDDDCREVAGRVVGKSLSAFTHMVDLGRILSCLGVLFPHLHRNAGDRSSG